MHALAVDALVSNHLGNSGKVVTTRAGRLQEPTDISESGGKGEKIGFH